MFKKLNKNRNNCFLVLTIILLSNCSINCEIIFWSHNHLENIAPSPLTIFNNDYFHFMLDILKPEKVIAFVDNTSNHSTIAKLNLPKFRQLVESRISVYIPENLPIQLDSFSTGKFKFNLNCT